MRLTSRVLSLPAAALFLTAFLWLAAAGCRPAELSLAQQIGPAGEVAPEVTAGQTTPLPTLARIEPTLPAPILPPPVLPTPQATSTLLPSPIPPPEPAVTPTTPASGVVHLAAVGDLMLDRDLGTLITRGLLDFPFEAMREELVPPDLTVGNLECSLGDLGQPDPVKIYTFQAPPGAAEALARGGFDLVTLANNHALDYGPEALLQGIDLLQAAGVNTVGAGRNRDEAHRPVIVEINGVRLAFLAYVNVAVEPNGFDTASWEATADSAGLAWGRLDEMQADIKAVKPQVDHVIVLLHAGYEYLWHQSEAQIELTRGAIDAGATLVIGHHAHILQPVNTYKNGVIAVGLGNFAFDIDGDTGTAVLHIWLDREGVIETKVVPAVIEETGRPRPATFEEGQAILAAMVTPP